jgi:hypothetical protein
MRFVKVLLLPAAIVLCSGAAFSQTTESPTPESQAVEKEAAAIVEIGGAPSWILHGGGWSFGPTVAVEVTPIENRLELEAGVTPLFSPHSTEWDTDLLFKKPWTLSRKVEFMVGVGPEWIHTNEYRMPKNAIGRGGAGFHVLALEEAQIRLVRRTSL